MKGAFSIELVSEVEGIPLLPGLVVKTVVESFSLFTICVFPNQGVVGTHQLTVVSESNFLSLLGSEVRFLYDVSSFDDAVWDIHLVGTVLHRFMQIAHLRFLFPRILGLVVDALEFNHVFIVQRNNFVVHDDFLVMVREIFLDVPWFGRILFRLVCADFLFLSCASGLNTEACVQVRLLDFFFPD